MVLYCYLLFVPLLSFTAYGTSSGLVVVPDDQGPVVQSIVSLTSSLRGQLVKCLMN